MADKDQDIWNIISSVIEKTATEEEYQYFQNWLTESPENTRTYGIISNLGSDADNTHEQVAKNIIYNKVQKRIYAFQNRHQIRIWQYIAAASISLLIAVGSWSYFRATNKSASAFIETQTAFGVRTQVTLPDGTNVNLNAGSTLKYPAVFTGKTREVDLKGEAYFEVTKDAKHPFIVKTKYVNVNVLGTHFNVQAYNEDKQLVTTLLEGSISITGISVTNSEKAVVLIPNQQAVYDKSSNRLSLRTIDGNQFIAWKAGAYYFENEELSEIAIKLERGFNTPVRIASVDLKKQVFSGVFDKGESLSRILNIMKRHRNIDFKIVQDTIIIYKK